MLSEIPGANGAPARGGTKTRATTADATAPAKGGSRLMVVYLFLLAQFACQLALLAEALAPLRLIFRTAAFGMSLGLLIVVRGKPGNYHPARPVLLLVALMMLVQLLHPDRAGYTAAVANVMLYVAIFAPVFWVGRLGVTPRVARNIIILLWAYHSVGSLLGVLQAYFPGQLQPALSTLITSQGKWALKYYEMELASGVRTLRPMGLTDTPGGAAQHGMYAFLLGMGIIQSKGLFVGGRALALASMLLGMVVLYLCQVRSLVVMAGICASVMLLVLTLSGRVSRLAMVAMLVPMVAFGAFFMAVALGGDAVVNRLGTLFASDFGTIYYQNRGSFLEQAFEDLLPKYPFGAGLGRWGMVNYYFARGARQVWAEIQWTAWIVDGGGPLVLAYVSAMLITTWHAWRIASDRSDSDMGVWGSILLSYNIGAFALTFSYPVFAGNAGLEYWFLNAVVFYGARSALGTRTQTGYLRSRPAPLRGDVPRLGSANRREVAGGRDQREWVTSKRGS